MPSTSPATAGLQKLAMGLVLTIVDTVLGGYDAVPDVLGWLLVLLGLRDLRMDPRSDAERRVSLGTLVPLAVLAGAVSVATLRPEWLAGLPESSGWLLSLPQIAFSLVLCTELAPLVGDARATSLRRLRWAFGVVAVGPVLLYGGGVDVLLVPLAILTVAANVYLVYLLYRCSRELEPPAPDTRRAAP